MFLLLNVHSDPAHHYTQQTIHYHTIHYHTNHHPQLNKQYISHDLTSNHDRQPLFNMII